ncbi:hypothetical protein M8P87_18870 [Pseudomonas stutzeri]|jgi:hypothetical protein|uniref:N-acetyltransferase domain-containing protein n=1 Tax=Ectopseudomonas oleovorans TaxID=301 RepID=A0A379K0N0_ECTOL|nr:MULTISPECIES: hypothetical protein [Pseudomonadaceae]MCQ4231906.1 hypothetical protein [Stutzerimonas stutzeri]MEC6341508.1 hypothetical protein [Pseudomonas aeruginosa]SUD58042.1 Uncharacterised protein [Pseudomonas oleovorans]SUD58080.1 Uncharacterised protein [Pseudomonas oleovorans]
MVQQQRAEAVTEHAYEVCCELLREGLERLPWAQADLKHLPGLSKSRLSIVCRQKDDKDIETLVLIVDFLHDSCEIEIPNILMPDSMKHQRLGKRVISALYDVAEAHGYELFVVDMVNSFFERLCRRGAIPLNHDKVQITASTNLVGAEA